MKWIFDYQLFLFDFDGLLVNSEELHFAAYRHMCEQRGFRLNWDFATFSRAAHYDSTGLEKQMYADLPALKIQQPDWGVLYQEKKQAYLQLLAQGNTKLMPGVQELLEALQQANIKRCVVTHSPMEQILMLRQQLPMLNSIPKWITREQYHHPKPHPECYLTAIEQFAGPDDNIIGFEDTPRGLQALLGTRANAMLISTAFEEPQIQTMQMKMEKSFQHYPCFSAIG